MGMRSGSRWFRVVRIRSREVIGQELEGTIAESGRALSSYHNEEGAEYCQSCEYGGPERCQTVLGAPGPSAPYKGSNRQGPVPNIKLVSYRADLRQHAMEDILTISGKSTGEPMHLTIDAKQEEGETCKQDTRDGASRQRSFPGWFTHGASHGLARIRPVVDYSFPHAASNACLHLRQAS